MPSDRKFYKTIITVEILSEDVPPEWDDLEDIYYLIGQGDCSGMITSDHTFQVDASTIAKALLEQNTDPSFFNLTETGEDIDD
jgi:hypothetical protein